MGFCWIVKNGTQIIAETMDVHREVETSSESTPSLREGDGRMLLQSFYIQMPLCTLSHLGLFSHHTGNIQDGL
ncbi:MAG: hypothetical protein D6726_04625 [Nitrospirae bacterium]|nr:MAG: hypothetical protein D6726_04625 [Nitrospirota bacterium]